MRTAQCFNCQHFLGGDGPLICRAFWDGIPEAILTGEHDHTQPFDGDDGIRFEPVDPALVTADADE